MTNSNTSGVSRLALALLATVAYVQAQTQTPATPHFEVASVKALPGGGRGGRPSGGPGTGDMAQFSWPGVPLVNLIARAYMIGSDQVTGPAWLNSEMYSIAVKIPPGTTDEQFGVMLQNLLLERFQMTLHHETKVIGGYDLVVAKGGSKLKPSVATEMRGGGQYGPDGATLTYDKATVPVFANMLAMRIRVGDLAEKGAVDPGPVVVRVADKTGLTGDYDFKLHYTMPSNDTPGEDLLSAVQSQLGLTLKPAKISVDMIVIDRAEKTPTEN